MVPGTGACLQFTSKKDFIKRALVEKERVDDSSNVLAALGYRIKWRRIDSEQTEVFKESKNLGD
jgi:hypothetical protein